MSALLYFVSFSSVSVLFASIIAGALWVVKKFVQAWARFFAVLLAPPNMIVVTNRPRIDLQHLKRAGQ
jgi:hypothetical protein